MRRESWRGRRRRRRGCLLLQPRWRHRWGEVCEHKVNERSKNSIHRARYLGGGTEVASDVGTRDDKLGRGVEELGGEGLDAKPSRVDAAGGVKSLGQNNRCDRQSLREGIDPV
jgi:hypothetical protein